MDCGHIADEWANCIEEDCRICEDLKIVGADGLQYPEEEE
jgi:hypothetical protein